MTSSPARPLIGADDLAAALAAPNPPVVLDARWTLGRSDGRQQFVGGHIPGSRFVDFTTELADPAGDGSRGRHPLPSPTRFAAAMRRVGVDAGPVVVLDDGSALPAARLWWLLRDAGHDDVRLLDGGLAAWVAAGQPLAEGADAPVAPGTWVPAPGQRRQLDVAAVARAVAAGDPLLLVDVRAAARFRGETEPIDPVAGHIPGARNVPATENLADGRFRPPAELAAQFAAAGVDATATVYCGSGVTACQSLLALELAGIDGAALFAGSWSAWVADRQRPVATEDG